VIALFTSPSSRLRRFKLGGIALLMAVVLPCAALAQQQEDKDNKQLSDKVQEGLAKFKALQDAQNWAGILSLVNDLMKDVKRDSYDEAILSSIRGQMYVQTKDYGKAIDSLETAIHVSDRHHFFGDRETDAICRYLMQLYYQEATTPGRPLQQQQAYFAKACDYIKRLIDHAPKPNPDDLYVYASLLFNRALLNPEKPDIALITEARKVGEQSLYLTAKPKEQTYTLILATLQQQQEYARMAEYLELLVKEYPKSNNYWQQLFASYYSMAADEKLKRESFENNVRAILTIERAQANGAMNTPKDNLNLVGIYFAINQFDRACALLDAGLKNGAIEPDQKNWELLAYSYQQVNKEQKAIDVLKEAAKHFPKSGSLDYQAAVIYYSLDKIADAYREAKVAAAKGVQDKNGAVWAFIAYCAFDLQKYDEALEAAQKATTFPDSQKDKQLPQLRKAIDEKIEERKYQNEVMKQKQKQA
jgi:hypothetical protein